MNMAVEQVVPAKAARHWRWYAATVLASVAALAYGQWWWANGRFYESTDDAYVGADWVTVSSRVPGYVEAVAVGDDEPVQAGQVLLRVQAADYQARVDEATAEQRQAAAAVASAEAQVRRSEADRQRYLGLVRDQAATPQRLEQARASAARDKAALQAASAQLSAVAARLALARQNLDSTVVRAPLSGVVGQRRVRAGQYLAPGQPALAVVPVATAYVLANFKETQLEHMRVGQAATIEVDSYPGQRLHGHVVSFSPGAGSVFTLLPPDNATGNFTKVVQRFPVRILLDGPATGQPVLPGMSVTATVDTRAARGTP